MKRHIKSFLNKFGYQITRYPNIDISRRIQIIKNHNINKVIDVGANLGQYSLELRKFGFCGNIISFEPLSKTYSQLQQKTSNDKKWQTYNIAIGNEDGEAIINVANNTYSSSINNMLESHLIAAPTSRYVSKEIITIKKIDTIFNNICCSDDIVLLKIDTQGYEKQVLEGARKSLNKILLLQLEMSLIPLYENELIIADMIKFLEKIQFELISLENGFVNNETGQLLQVDGIFVNKQIKSHQ
jgi:FkbM family methyltransferase